MTTAATELAKRARGSSGPGVGAFAYSMSCSSSAAISAFRDAFSVIAACSLRVVSRVAAFSASSAAVADASCVAAASEAERDEASRESTSASRVSSVARAEEDSASCGGAGRVPRHRGAEASACQRAQRRGEAADGAARGEMGDEGWGGNNGSLLSVCTAETRTCARHASSSGARSSTSWHVTDTTRMPMNTAANAVRRMARMDALAAREADVL